MKRTPTRAEGGVTEKEKEEMDTISKKWIEIAFKTGSTNHDKLKKAIKGLYKAADLEEPRVVIVPSPLIMAYAYGLSAGWWAKNTKIAATDDATDAAIDDATRAATYAATDAAIDDATDEATDDATDDATRAATYDATDAATDDATRDATDAATDAATRAATYAATYAATRAATHAATDAATYAATRAATYAATYDETKQNWLYLLAIYFAKGNKITAKLMINCINRWASIYQGGNMWSAYPSYFESMRDIIGLKGLDCWKKYKFWEDAAKYGGFRVMHKKFCIVSEFPEILIRPINGRLHCETGPTHRWKDGFEIYHLNGIRVPKWLVMTDSGKIDPKLALTEKNVDVQREIIRKVGAERMLKACNAETLDIFIDKHTKVGNEYKLMRMKVGDNIDRKYLYFEHASLPGVWYAHGLPPNTKKAIHGRAWILGIGELDELEGKSDEEIRECLPVEVA